MTFFNLHCQVCIDKDKYELCTNTKKLQNKVYQLRAFHEARVDAFQLLQRSLLFVAIIHEEHLCEVPMNRQNLRTVKTVIILEPHHTG